MTLIQLPDCTFQTETNDRGQFVGRCREFPDLRTRSYRSRLDAVDAIVDQVRDAIRKRDGVSDIARKDSGWNG